MLSLKRLLLGFLALAIALGVWGGSWSLVTASSGTSLREVDIRFEKKIDVALGQAGIFMPSSAFAGTLELTREPPKSNLEAKFHPTREPPKSNLEAKFHPSFITRWLEVRITNLDGKDEKIAYGLNYVYFQSTRVLKRYFDEGNLAIYRYDAAKKNWVECPSKLIEKGKKFRIVCIAPSFGVYGLATK